MNSKIKKIITTLVTIIIVLGIASFFADSQPATNNSLLPNNVQVTPPQATISPTIDPNIPLKLTYTSPVTNKPAIAGSTTAIYYAFNRPLTLSEIDKLIIVSNSGISFKKIIHKNRMTIYFTPNQPWKLNQKYTINLRVPNIQEPFIMTFTPAQSPPIGDVINSSEREH